MIHNRRRVLNEVEKLENLVMGAQKKDLVAFQRLYESTYPRFTRLAFLLTGHEDLANDVLQDSFVVCFRKIDTLSDPFRYLSWFTQILVRIANRSKRVMRRDPGIEEPNLIVDSQGGSSEEELWSRVERGEVRKALATLPQKHLVTLVLYFFEDLTIRQIAETMGTNEGTIKSRLFNGKRKLRKALLRSFEPGDHAIEDPVQEENHGSYVRLI